jgi:hypothetical protein
LFYQLNRHASGVVVETFGRILLSACNPKHFSDFFEGGQLLPVNLITPTDRTPKSLLASKLAFSGEVYETFSFNLESDCARFSSRKLFVCLHFSLWGQGATIQQCRDRAFTCDRHPAG